MFSGTQASWPILVSLQQSWSFFNRHPGILFSASWYLVTAWGVSISPFYEHVSTYYVVTDFSFPKSGCVLLRNIVISIVVKQHVCRSFSQKFYLCCVLLDESCSFTVKVLQPNSWVRMAMCCTFTAWLASPLADWWFLLSVKILFFFFPPTPSYDYMEPK